ncbi:MAG: hydroxymethylglutaryl-CoA lyase [Sphingobacteriales bacterium]|nr:hydroxymethylglutaryl-CoA lyase [Sphingobacteriales bacterium]
MKDFPIKLIECPRDAMQGWHHPINTVQKINYINALLKVGFHTIDFGSFVSPKAIPQMADTAEVLKGLDLCDTKSSLLAIVANLRGAETALSFTEIDYLGFPFSVSETFQQRNANASMATSFETVKSIQEACVPKGKKLVIYLSMGFGNPYGDPYDEALVLEWANRMHAEGIGIISLADTVGLATAEQVERVTNTVIKALPDIEIGVHLHAAATDWEMKFQAALTAGCTRFDGALKGIGGCPMAGDALVGNMNTEWMIDYLIANGRHLDMDKPALENASSLASTIFSDLG